MKTKTLLIAITLLFTLTSMKMTTYLDSPYKGGVGSEFILENTTYCQLQLLERNRNVMGSVDYGEGYIDLVDESGQIKKYNSLMHVINEFAQQGWRVTDHNVSTGVATIHFYLLEK